MPCGVCLNSECCGYRLLAEPGEQDTKTSIDRTVSLPPATSCACPAEHGAGGDGPQRTLFGKCESVPCGPRLSLGVLQIRTERSVCYGGKRIRQL